MIDIRSLGKTYRVTRRPPGLWPAIRSLWHREWTEVAAVRELSFSIAAGERVGFLGPNGAGKTTTLKMLSGLLHPTSGEVRVAGFEPARREVAFLKTVTLVMGQKQQLLWDLPASETFALNGALFDVPRQLFKRTLDELTELLQLGQVLEKPVRSLSLGERMKCELVAALLHRPRVLFLDEPTIGLDVTMQSAVRDFIRRYNEQTGATVLLTSHYMEDVAALCPRVIVVDGGTLRFDGALSELVRRVRPHKRVSLTFSRPVDPGDLQRFGRVITQDGTRVTLEVPHQELPQVVSAAMMQLPVSDLDVTEPPLEDVLRELFAGRSTEAA